MLRQRVITAIVLLACLLPTFWIASPVPFALLALLLASAGAWEWARLNGLKGMASVAYAALPAVAGLIGVSEGFASGGAVDAGGTLGLAAWIAVTLAWIGACAWLMPQGPLGWQRLGAPLRLFAGLVIVASTWISMSGARAVGVNFLLSVLCIVWVSDVSAYFAGHRWGRRKLAPALSPGKTWEGVAGAAVGVLLMAAAWMAAEARWAVDSPSVFTLVLDRHGPVMLVVAVVVLVALGILGDLFESMVKRAAGVKDSSGLLPGHGGVLDRIDALLPVLPAAMGILALGA